MARDAAKWRISAREALRRIENEGATVADVASAAGVSTVTFSRHIGEAGYVVLRWALDREAMKRDYRVTLRNTRILYVAELRTLHRAIEKRHGATVSLAHLCSVVGLPVSAAPRIGEIIDASRDDDSIRQGSEFATMSHGQQWSMLNIQPLPGDEFSAIEVDPLRDDHRYQRRKSTLSGASRSNRPRKRLHMNTAQMISKYQDGAGLREVADEAGTSPATVARRLREYGVPIRAVGRH